MKKQTQHLTNNLLIAMPGLKDNNFQESVSLICRHDEYGAMGIVVNRKLEINLGEIFDQLKIKPKEQKTRDVQVYFGGPVFPDRGFILHTDPGNWNAGIHVDDGLYVTSSSDILEAIARGEGPEQYMVALGCAGWGEGQLERELMENSWLNVPYNKRIVFETGINDRWRESAGLLGIDLSKISPFTGRA